MNRIQSITQEKAPGSARQLLEQIQKANNGKLPNMFLTLANSPQALQAFMNLSQCCAQTSLSKNLQEEIALDVSETNKCNYCISAHSYLAKNLGIKENDILDARKAQNTSDKKTNAILKFARSVMEKHGGVSEQELNSLKQMGVSDREICEIVLCVCMNTFTNFFNKVTEPEIDFPQAPRIQ